MLFLLFDQLVKQFRIDVGLFRSLGRNAIACYAIHGFLIDAIGDYVPKSAAISTVLVALLGLIAVLYGLARLLEARKIFIRL